MAVKKQGFRVDSDHDISLCDQQKGPKWWRAIIAVASRTPHLRIGQPFGSSIPLNTHIITNRQIKILRNKFDKSRSLLPSEIVSSTGEFIRNPTEIANELNRYFTDIPSVLRERLLQENTPSTLSYTHLAS